MAAPKRNKTEREADLVVIADLYRRSWSMRQIAAEVSRRRTYTLTDSTIKHDLDLILSRWKEKQAQYIDNFIVVQLEQIAAMKKELWEEYIRSKNPTRKIKEKRNALNVKNIHASKEPEDLVDLELDYIFMNDTSKPRPNATPLDTVEIHFTDLSDSSGVEVDQTLEVSENIGNPKFLELIGKFMDQEARLLGFYNMDNITPTMSVVIVNVPKPASKEIFTPLDQNFDEEF